MGGLWGWARLRQRPFTPGVVTAMCHPGTGTAIVTTAAIAVLSRMALASPETRFTVFIHSNTVKSLVVQRVSIDFFLVF